MLGDKPIIKRYIGDKLVWEPTSLLKVLDGCFLQFNDDFSEYITIIANDYRFTDVSIVGKVTFNGIEVNTMKSFVYSNYQFRVMFESPEAKQSFIQKMNWQNGSSVSGVTVRLYRK